MRVSRPAMEKKRRRRVLVVTTGSPRPMRAVQRARLWAITWTDSQAALVGLQFHGVPLTVGDAAVIAVVGEEGQLGAERGLDPPDDEPHGCGVGLTLKGSVAGLRHIGGAVRPVRDGRPVLFGYGLDQVTHAIVLADGDGEADIHFAADGDDGVGIEAAVGPHGELTRGTGVAHPPHLLAQEVGGPRTVLARPSRSRNISTSPVPGPL